MSEEKRFDDECLDEEYGFKGISRFTCYKPTYTIDEWENQEIIKEWDIMRVKEDYFSFLVYVNKIFKENEQLKQNHEYVLRMKEKYKDDALALAEKNEQLKQDAKQVLFVLACCDEGFKLTINEAKAIKRLNDCVNGCYEFGSLKELEE